MSSCPEAGNNRSGALLRSRNKTLIVNSQQYIKLQQISKYYFKFITF